MPMAAIAVTNRNRETSLKKPLIPLGMATKLLMTTKSPKANANHGSNGGRLDAVDPPISAL